jgi:FG-GAP-like repeat/Cadherin-like
MTVFIVQSPLLVNRENTSFVYTILPSNLTTEDTVGAFQYVVQTTPTRGSLTVNGVLATSGTTFTQADIDTGKVKYQFAGGTFSQDGFSFFIHDSLGDTPSSFDMNIFALWKPAAVGDFNADGITDVTWQTFATTPAGTPLLAGSSEWLMSQNGGLLGAPLTSPSAPDPWFLPRGALDAFHDAFATFFGAFPRPIYAGAGDFNRDGFTDLLWVNSSTGQTSEYLGSQSGLFTPVGTPSSKNGWTLLSQGDFNGDNTPDVVWQNLSTDRSSADAGQIEVWLGQRGQAFKALPSTDKAFSDEWQLAAQGDFNGDGVTDLMWRGIGVSAGKTSEWLGDPKGSGDFTPAASQPATGYTLVAAGDFNGDRIDDVLWKNDSSGTISVWLGGGGSNGGWTFPTTPSPGAGGWTLTGEGDFNGDGRTDLFWTNSGGATSEWLGQQNGGFHTLSLPPVTGYSLAAQGDFNGDAIPDLLWVNSSTGLISEWLGGGGSNGGFVFKDNINIPWPVPPLDGTAQQWSVAAQGDFNRDGTTDLLWLNALTGLTMEWLMSPNGGLLAVPPTPPGSASGSLSSAAMDASDLLGV